MAGKVETGANARPVDGRNHRHFQPTEGDVGLHLVAEVEAIAFDIHGTVRRLRLATATAARHVHAGAEATAGAGDDDAAHGAVEARIDEDLPHLAQERERQCVQALRSVQRQPDDAVLLALAFAQNLVGLGHVPLPLALKHTCDDANRLGTLPWRRKTKALPAKGAPTARPESRGWPRRGGPSCVLGGKRQGGGMNRQHGTRAFASALLAANIRRRGMGGRVPALALGRGRRDRQRQPHHRRVGAGGVQAHQDGQDLQPRHRHRLHHPPPSRRAA